MNIKIQYRTDAVVLPGQVTKVIQRATKNDLRVLLALCADRRLCITVEGEDYRAAIAAAAGCTEAQVEASVAFWRGAGILDLEEEEILETEADATAETPAVAEKTPRATPPRVADTPSIEDATSGNKPATEKSAVGKTAKPAPHAALPRYTTEQLADLLEQRHEAAAFIDEAQRIWGKIFNTHEVNVLLGLVDYLGLDWEYVLTLLAYCAAAHEKRGIHKSLRYLESTAFGFYDEGVRTLAELQERLKQIEAMAEVEGQLRTLFGMGARALTPKEKKCFSTWLYEYRYGMDIIKLAYDVTVDAKGSPNLSYMNSVLANWNRDGLRTPEAVKAAQEAFHAEQEKARTGGKGKPPAPTGSFDTDDFFSAAVRRSFGDDFDDGDTD